MKINNIEVQAPIIQNFKIDAVEISISARTASARLVKDIIAIKNKFSLTYNGLRYADYKTFLDTYKVGSPVPFTYLDSDIEQTATVMITSMPRGIYQEKSTISHSVTIVMEEV